MKTFLSFVAVGFFLVGCVNKPAETTVVSEQELPEAQAEVALDASSGATGLGVVAIEISKADAVTKTYEFLKANRPYFVSTIDRQTPRVRPTGVSTLHDGKIWFHAGRHKGVYQQIKKNPNVEITVVGPNREWIRITGKAFCDESPELERIALDANPHLKKMYNAETNNKLGSFGFKDARVEISKPDGTVEAFSL